MADNQSLFDTLAGSFGHGVDRPGLEAFVANSQAMNGLRTAQTEAAIINAQQRQEEMQASQELESSLGGVLGDDGKPLLNPSAARLVATELKAKLGDAKTVMEAFRATQQAHNTGVLSNPNNLGTPAATAAAQGNTNNINPAEQIPGEYVAKPGMTVGDVQQTPGDVALSNQRDANASLANAKAANGGFNPHSSAVNGLDDAHLNALQTAVNDGRLDPARVNSRTAGIFAELEMRNPGGTNFNRLTADAALQRNAGFQQRTIGLESLPAILSNMTTLGKKVGYNDIRTVAKMQQWANGEFNDPDYTEYMTVRNDALMKIANLMRGVGMSDKAHEAEVQAAAPTLAPNALDAWLKGQMATLTPLLEKTQRVQHLGEKGQGTPSLVSPGATPTPAPAPAPGATPTPAALPTPISLDDYLKSKGH